MFFRLASARTAATVRPSFLALYPVETFRSRACSRRALASSRDHALPSFFATMPSFTKLPALVEPAEDGTGDRRR